MGRQFLGLTVSDMSAFQVLPRRLFQWAIREDNK